MEKRLGEWNVFVTWGLCSPKHVVEEAFLSHLSRRAEVSSVGNSRLSKTTQL